MIFLWICRELLVLVILYNHKLTFTAFFKAAYSKYNSDKV